MALWKNKVAGALLCPCCVVFPLSVTLLCGHSRAWFGYACSMWRTGDEKKKEAQMNVDMHGHTHERFLFKKMHFTPAAV